MRKMLRSAFTRTDDGERADTQPSLDDNDRNDDASFPDDDDASFEKIQENDEKRALDDETNTDFDDDFDIDDEDNLSLDGLDDGADGPEPLPSDMPPPYLGHSAPSTMVVGDAKQPPTRLEAPAPAPANVPLVAPAPAPALTTPLAPAPAPAPPRAPLAAFPQPTEARLIDLDDDEATVVTPTSAGATSTPAGAPAPRSRLFNIRSAQPPVARSSGGPRPRAGVADDLNNAFQDLSVIGDVNAPSGRTRLGGHGSRLFPSTLSQPNQPQSQSRPRSTSQRAINPQEEEEELLGAEPDDWFDETVPGGFNAQSRRARFLDDSDLPPPGRTNAATRRPFRAQASILPEYDLATPPRRSSSGLLPPYSQFPEEGPPNHRGKAAANPERGRGRSGLRMCTVCHIRPAYHSGGREYPTCGLNCAAALHRNNGRPPQRGNNNNNDNSNRNQGRGFDNTIQNPFVGAGDALLSFFQSRQRSTSEPPRDRKGDDADDFKDFKGYGRLPCVICMRRPALSAQIPTCSPECAERLCAGDADPRMCDYCHRRPKVHGYNQCGRTCGQLAKNACLLCRSRPKFRQYHLCGKTCRQIASNWTPLLLEAPREHETFKLVEKKFKDAWQGGPTEPLPKIRHIYKIVEDKAFLRPYDRYKRKHGNEIFTYHGTKRRCTLGSNGNTRLCNDTGCKLCQILKTSFSTRLANPRGSFGAGIYSSTSSNSAHFYTGKGTGAIIVSKVVLGKAYTVNNFNAVTSCPSGYDSVVFNHKNGARNETVVYTDDAIRPVFMIVFK